MRAISNKATAKCNSDSFLTVAREQMRFYTKSGYGKLLMIEASGSFRVKD
jgi:hypothetical protein